MFSSKTSSLSLPKLSLLSHSRIPLFVSGMTIALFSSYLLYSYAHRFRRISNRRVQGHTKESLLALKNGLTKSSTYNIEYDGFFSNHLTHGIIALYQLGASDKDINSFIDHYTRKLEPPPPEPLSPITLSNWRDFMGKRQRFVGLRQFFKSELQRLDGNWRSLVRLYMPELVHGMIASATHPTIQIGWAIDIMHLCPFEGQQMLIDGFAYLVYSYLDLCEPFHLLRQMGELSKARVQVEEESEVKRKRGEFKRIEKYQVAGQTPLTIWDVIGLVTELFASRLRLIDLKSQEEKYKVLGLGSFQGRLAVLSVEYHQDWLEFYRLLVQIRGPSFYTGFSEDEQGQRIAEEKEIEELVSEVTKAVNLLYAISNDDFFLLHGLTLWFGLRHIIKTLDRPEHKREAIHAYLLVSLGVFIAQDMPGVDSPFLKQALKEKSWKGAAKGFLASVSATDIDGLDPLQWAPIIRTALDKQCYEHEHYTKLAYVCHEDAYNAKGEDSQLFRQLLLTMMKKKKVASHVRLSHEAPTRQHY
jgi:hypothetical protein